MDEVLAYLKDNGFVPLRQDAGCTLFVKNKFIISINGIKTLYQLKRKLEDIGKTNPEIYSEPPMEVKRGRIKRYRGKDTEPQQSKAGEPATDGRTGSDAGADGSTDGGAGAGFCGNVDEGAKGINTLQSPDNPTHADVKENGLEGTQVQTFANQPLALPQHIEEENIFKESSEDVDPFYIAELVKAIPTPLFRRLNIDGNRFYYRTMDDGSVKIYASATNLIKDGYAEDKTALQDWKMQMKFLGQNPEETARYEADKGTIMHYLFDLYLTGRNIKLQRSFISKTVQDAKLSISKENILRFTSSMDDLDNMIERIIRFARFCNDYKVEPIMIEKVLSLEEYEVASPIDLVCRMTVKEKEEGFFGETYKRSGNGYKAGDPKKSVREVERTYFAIVDFKSGGIYSSHSLQLELYRRMVEAWYGDLVKVEKIYNFSPKSESGKGYTLRDQTECKELRKADAVYMQGMINHQNKDKTFRFYTGTININNGFDESKHVVVYDIAEELQKLNN